MRCAIAVLLGSILGTAPLAAQEGQTGQQPDRFLDRCHGSATGEHASADERSRFPDECIPLADLPSRPKPLIELGEPFLGTGTLHPGIRLPTGAVWQPAFLAFGQLRTAAQMGRLGLVEDQLGEAVGRLDLFGNLYLTQTERILVGLRPLDQDGAFTGYTFSEPAPPPPAEEEEAFRSELNATVRTLFMEGDLGEVFPVLDPNDSGILDIYFSVGRQPLGIQEGGLLNDDALDMVGLTRANMKLGSAVNTRITAVAAWGEVNRQGRVGNAADPSASLYGLFSEVDFRSTTVELDAAYVAASEETGSGIYVGAGDIRRIGRFNNAMRVMASFPVGTETEFNSRGVLVQNQFSWTPHHSHDFWYIGTFVGLQNFRSAARGPSMGGPVGGTGLLFAAPGIGRIGAPLGSLADEAVGGAIGHQKFFSDRRQQVVAEVGARYRLNADAAGRDLAGVGLRYQAAMGQRFVFVLDGFGAYDFEAAASDAFGRIELVLKL